MFKYFMSLRIDNNNLFEKYKAIQIKIENFELLRILKKL